jgi:hypothetical protein
MRNLIQIASILFLLSGCVSISKERLEEVERGEKAMVISRCTAIVPIMGGDDVTEGCIIRWVKYSNGRETKIFVPKLNSPKSLSIEFIEPGIYQLTSVSAITTDSNYIKTYSFKDISNVASFKVGGGEIIYIGDLSFNFSDSGEIDRAISIVDNTALVKKLLSGKQQILEKMQVRLIQLSPAVIEAKTIDDHSIRTNFAW